MLQVVSPAGAEPVSNFALKTLKLLDRVEYRRIETREDMEEIGNLRFRSYDRHSLLSGDFHGRIIDETDFDRQAYVIGVYIDEQLVSTVRIHYISPDHRVGTSMSLFPDVLGPMLDKGMTFADSARFAADPETLRDYPAIAYLTLRASVMATDYFHVNYSLSSVQPTHAGFYRRVFNAVYLAEPRKFEGINVPIVILGSDGPVNLPKVYRRYPFFRSQPFERRMMFERNKRPGSRPLTILPTAKYSATGL